MNNESIIGNGAMTADIADYIRSCRQNGLQCTFACEDCHKRFKTLRRDGRCRKCHHKRLKEGNVTGGTIRTIRGGEPPISTYGMSEYCGNGHKWRPETTRWRYRDRGGRHGTGWERDCLLCKQKSEGYARMGKNVKGRNVTITINKNGTHWNSGHPGGKES